MLEPTALTAVELAKQIETYFITSEEDQNPAKQISKEPKHESAAITLSGLAYFLGFESRGAFADYEENGKFPGLLKRARLYIEAAYERKLHQQSPTGAVFALKNMGWNEKADDKAGNACKFKTLKIEVVETGFVPASSEKEVAVNDLTSNK